MSSYTQLNPSARDWVFADEKHHKIGTEGRVLAFHQTLPDYAETPLRALPEALARELGVGRVLLKDESNRFGLPAFKILGASWAVYRAVAAHLKLDNEAGALSIAQLGARAREAGVSVVTSTEGNCGRAVARMAARYLGIPARVHVPRYMDETTRAKIRGEGAEVCEVAGSYDDTIPVIGREAEQGENVVLILDVSFDDYRLVPSVS